MLLKDSGEFYPALLGMEVYTWSEAGDESCGENQGGDHPSAAAFDVGHLGVMTREAGLLKLNSGRASGNGDGFDFAMSRAVLRMRGIAAAASRPVRGAEIRAIVRA